MIADSSKPHGLTNYCAMNVQLERVEILGNGMACEIIEGRHHQFGNLLLTLLQGDDGIIKIFLTNHFHGHGGSDLRECYFFSVVMMYLRIAEIRTGVFLGSGNIMAHSLTLDLL